jgi:hypothetical protein
MTFAFAWPWALVIEAASGLVYAHIIVADIHFRDTYAVEFYYVKYK